MHQFVVGPKGQVVTEELFGDRIVSFLYSRAREQAPVVFRLLTGARISSLLGFVHFDLPLAPRLLGNRRFLARCGVELGECVDPPEFFTTPRRIFERQIRYWQCRPMPAGEGKVVAPADARMLCGSLAPDSPLFIKDKFFRFPELLGPWQQRWLAAFAHGDYAIFRLTPDKYHYNHLPVSGRVEAVYELEGDYHSCNPAAVVAMVTPYSRNRRTVTIIQTDVAGGSGVGLVAMIEVVAMMIGKVAPWYSEHRYDTPRPLVPGMFVRRGQPKSLYRPGSSTDLLLFQPGRIRFDPALTRQMRRPEVSSRFSLGFGRPLVEVEVQVRSLIAEKTEPRSFPWKTSCLS